MKKFEVNQQLTARSICNHECIFTGSVIKRTSKTVTIKTDHGIERRKIFLDSEGNEMIWPFGTYSMAPIFRA